MARLDRRYSSDGAEGTSWREVTDLLSSAEVSWISTVRPDGRPHVTPLICVWIDDALHFCTGPEERKARNLAHNPFCVLTTGCNRLGSGLDAVVEGRAERVTETQALTAVATALEAKYGSDWHFDVGDGVFRHGAGGDVVVFRVEPTTVLAFGRGEEYSQTRLSWRA